jgi:small subunit ribosomal protein S17
MSATEEATTPEAAPGRATRRRVTKIGIVTSNKMTQTVVVTVETLKAHKSYGRTMRRSKKFMAHDAESKCGMGDRVLIAETKPLSRSKRWRVVRIVKKAGVAE